MGLLGIIGANTKKLTRIALIVRGESLFLEFDATISAQHQGDTVITEHPVEQGSDVTDHIRRSPETLEINGIVSNTPLVILASLTAKPSVPGGDPRTRAEDAYNFLRRIKDQGQTVRVVTTLRDYQNMAIRSIGVSRDVTTRNILDIRLSLKEIVIATTETVEPPEPVVTAKKPRSNLGKKTKTPASENAEDTITAVFTALGQAAGL